MSIPLLTRADYALLDPRYVGKLVNRGYGTVEDVHVHCVEAGATSTITADMTASATSFSVLDASLFPAAPFTVSVGGELITVGAKSGNTFSSCTRASNAYPHPAGRTCYEVRTTYVYLVSDRPVKAITDVKIDGVKQTQGFTAYTGKAGDSYSGYTNKAVIVFAAEAWAGQQRNRAGSGSTEDVAASATIYTDTNSGVHQSHTSASYAANLPHHYVIDPLTAATSVSASFSSSSMRSGTSTALFVAPSGTILRTAAYVDLSYTWSPGTSTEPTYVLFTVRRSDTGSVIGHRRIRIETSGSSGTTSVTAGIDCGSYHGDVIVSVVAEVNITQLSATYYVTHTRLTAAAAETTATVAMRPTWCNQPAILGGYNSGTVAATIQAGGSIQATFDAFDTGLGVYVSDTITATTGSVTGSANYSWVARRLDGASLVAAGAEALGAHLHVGLTSAFRTFQKTVTYVPRNALSSGATAAHASTARLVIGERVTVTADWAVDETGDYGGSGNLIERPDWCIKHFLINDMGATAGEIDTTSFSAAGTLYAAAIAGGYKFGWIVQSQDAQASLRAMAFSARSSIKFLSGKWYLNFTPDTAPTSARTLTRDDLVGAGAQYIFEKDRLRQVRNAITALYAPNYSGDTNREVESGYLASVYDSDATSIAKYGEYRATYYLPCVRSSTMAAHVLAHHLLESQVPLLTVAFRAFWHHADLQPGQTITITNDIYTGRQWWIETMRRESKFIAAIVAREWW